MPPQDPTPTNGNGPDGTVGNRPVSVPVDWELLARATAHPLRISVLEILGLDGGRTLSPSELCRELQIPLSNTNYHVTELHKAGLIELARERQVRGATEHFYRLPATVIAKAIGELHAVQDSPPPATGESSEARAA